MDALATTEKTLETKLKSSQKLVSVSVNQRKCMCLALALCKSTLFCVGTVFCLNVLLSSEVLLF